MKKPFGSMRIFLVLLLFGGIFVFAIRFYQAGISGSGAAEKASPFGPEKKQAKPPVVAVVSAARQEIAELLTLTGTVAAQRVARLASPAEGPAGGIRVREGDMVDTGDQLLFIGRKQGVDALVASLRTALKNAADDLERTRRLVETNALAEEALDRARAEYESVRAELVRAEESAMDYIVSAPWKGVISHVHVNDGAFVTPRETVVEMYDPESLSIRTSVPERYAVAIAPGMRVDIRLDAYPEERMAGRVDRVYPYLDDRLRTRTIEIAPIPALENFRGLLPGMFARLTVVVRNVEGALVVPAAAIVSEDREDTVFIVHEGKALIRRVETGIAEGGRVEIKAGLSTGDKVIVKGREGLAHGDPVSLPGKEKTDMQAPDGDRRQ